MNKKTILLIAIIGLVGGIAIGYVSDLSYINVDEDNVVYIIYIPERFGDVVAVSCNECILVIQLEHGTIIRRVHWKDADYVIFRTE